MSTPSLAASSRPEPRLSLRRFASSVYVVAVLMLTSVGVGLAGRRGVLIPVAAPFAVVLVFALRVLRPAAERAAWAAFTLWLGSTYLQTGGVVERSVLLAYASMAAAGLFVSPWWLVAAWGVHPVWDLLPQRTLPLVLMNLPTACLLFDWVIAAYLTIASSRQRWTQGGL